MADEVPGTAPPLPRDDGEYTVVDEAGFEHRSTRDHRMKERSRSCAKRVDNGWCILPTEHRGACRAVVRMGPSIPPPDVVSSGSRQRELAEKYDDRVRDEPWKDRFGVMQPEKIAPADVWIARIEQR